MIALLDWTGNKVLFAMENLHTCVGVIGALALLITMTHTTSQVVVNAATPFCELVDVGAKAIERVAPGQQIPFIDCEIIHGPWYALKKTGQCIYKIMELFASADAQPY